MLRHGIQFRGVYVESSMLAIPVSKAHKYYHYVDWVKNVFCCQSNCEVSK